MYEMLQTQDTKLDGTLTVAHAVWDFAGVPLVGRPGERALTRSLRDQNRFASAHVQCLDRSIEIVRRVDFARHALQSNLRSNTRVIPSGWATNPFSFVLCTQIHLL